MMMRRLRRLSEAECYMRCYGAHERTVQVIRFAAARPRARPTVSGEQVRRLFEARLGSREPEPA